MSHCIQFGFPLLSRYCETSLFPRFFQYFLLCFAFLSNQCLSLVFITTFTPFLIAFCYSLTKPPLSQTRSTTPQTNVSINCVLLMILHNSSIINGRFSFAFSFIRFLIFVFHLLFVTPNLESRAYLQYFFCVPFSYF